MAYGPEATVEQVSADFASEIKGKTFLITGNTPQGLGQAFATGIAAHGPKAIILAGRTRSKGEATEALIHEVNPSVEVKHLSFDLSDQTKIRKAADEVNAYPGHIDVLVNNAALMGTEWSTTAEGIESQFGSNHIGHFLFTNLIMDKLLAAPAPRVVNVSSLAYRLTPFRVADYNFKDGKVYHMFRAYGQSKTANMLFTVALDKRLRSKGLTTVSLHPGTIKTNRLLTGDVDVEAIFGQIMALDDEIGSLGSLESRSGEMKSLSQGAATTAYAALAPDVKQYGGRFFSDSAVVPLADVRSWARDELEAEQLWKLSEKLTSQTFSY